MNNPNFPEDPQLTVTGRLSATNGGSEVIKFDLFLAFFHLKCIVTIPEEGTESAPVYIKFRIRKEKEERETPSAPSTFVRRPRTRVA